MTTLEQAAPQQEAQEPYGYVFAEQYAPIVGSELKTTREVFTRVKPDRQCLALYTAPQPAPAPLSDDTALLDGLARLNWYVGPGDFYCDEAGGMNDYDDKNSGPEELRQAIRAAIAAQGGKP